MFLYGGLIRCRRRGCHAPRPLSKRAAAAAVNFSRPPSLFAPSLTSSFLPRCTLAKLKWPLNPARAPSLCPRGIGGEDHHHQRLFTRGRLPPGLPDSGHFFPPTKLNFTSFSLQRLVFSVCRSLQRRGKPGSRAGRPEAAKWRFLPFHLLQKP